MKYSSRPMTFEDQDPLWEGLARLWDTTMPEEIQRLYDSFPRLMEAVLEAEGRANKY